LVARFGWRGSLICIGALEIGLRAFSNVVLVSTGEPLPLWFYGLPFIYWFSWSIGAAIADAYLSGRSLPFFNHSLLAWSAAAFGSSFLKPLASFSFLFFALLTATAIAKLLGPGSRPIPLGAFFAPLRSVGLWSYSIYLLHQPLLALAPRVAGKLSLFGHSQIVVFVLCLCLWFPIMALSAIWYRVFELPSIAFGKRFTTNAPNRALQRTGPVVTPVAASPPPSHPDHAADDLVQEGGRPGNLRTESIPTARSVRPIHE
jgi:peptidoglycan/LPS O-acetylase OafA/YrhL